jgi:MFS transporter, FSR family, fosmidomycin resistance protein
MIRSSIRTFRPSVATAIWLFVPVIGRSYQTTTTYSASGRGGFPLLLLIGILDSAVRMGLLTFLPFLLKEKGASLPTLGWRLPSCSLAAPAASLRVDGSASASVCCGPWWRQRAAQHCALWLFSSRRLPSAWPCFRCLASCSMAHRRCSTEPCLTSFVRTERAFALFYTATIGSGAIAPIIYGVIGDRLGIAWATWAAAMTALAICPFALILAPRLAPHR